MTLFYHIHAYGKVSEVLPPSQNMMSRIFGQIQTLQVDVFICYIENQSTIG